MNTITILNPDDKGFYSRCYHVQLGYYLSFNGIIYASCEQDAIDLLIDAYDNKDHIGWFMSNNELSELSDDEKECLIYGGNYCKYMSFGYEQLRMIELSEIELAELLASEKE